MNKSSVQALETLKEVKVLYDKKGKPEFVLLPFDQFKSPPKISPPKKTYNLTSKQIVEAIDEVRQNLFQKRYAPKIKSPS